MQFQMLAKALSLALHDVARLCPENVIKKNNGFTEPANMPDLDTQRADCEGNKTNSLMGAIHIPQGTAGDMQMPALSDVDMI